MQIAPTGKQDYKTSLVAHGSFGFSPYQETLFSSKASEWRADLQEAWQHEASNGSLQQDEALN